MKKALWVVGIVCVAVALGYGGGAGDKLNAQAGLADDDVGRWRLFQGTYDHHDENNGVTLQFKALFRIDTKTGSCSTLVSRLKADKTLQQRWLVIP